jgi:glucose/arabinose dehydrogenase
MHFLPTDIWRAAHGLSLDTLAGQSGVSKEIWALGFRNPWRFSFDRATGDLWIADVGQDAWEEVNFQPASSRGGENYGWNLMEGLHCYRAENCATSGYVRPVVEYGHGSTLNPYTSYKRSV